MMKRKCGGEIDGVEMRVEVKAKAEEVAEKERAEPGQLRRMEEAPTNPESGSNKNAPPSPTPVQTTNKYKAIYIMHRIHHVNTLV
jgi:hypothetical protein